MNEPESVVETLFAGCRRDHAKWINGDASGYELPDDATLMGAFGATTHGGLQTTGRQGATNSLWQSGSGDIQLIDAGVSGGVAWLIMVERASVVFKGRSVPTRWDLRVTELFRRRGESWERFHRHADPLVDGHGLDEIVRLLG